MNIVINYYIFFKRNYFKIGTYFVFRLFLHQAHGLCQKEKRSFKRRMNLLFSCGWPLNSLRRIYEEKSYLFKERHFVVNLHTVNSCGIACVRGGYILQNKESHHFYPRYGFYAVGSISEQHPGNL